MSELYYAAMARPNVHLHSSYIDKIVGQTIYTNDGLKEEIDVSNSGVCKLRFSFLFLFNFHFLSRFWYWPLGFESVNTLVQ